MRMLFLPVILALSACASIVPPGSADGKTYFNYPPRCEGCEKNDIDRYGDRSRP